MMIILGIYVFASLKLVKGRNFQNLIDPSSSLTTVGCIR